MGQRHSRTRQVEGCSRVAVCRQNRRKLARYAGCERPAALLRICGILKPTVKDIDALIASLMALRRKVAAAERKAKRRLLTIQAIRCLAVIAHFAIYVVQHLLVRDIVFAFNFAAILERRVTSRQENEGLCVQ